MREPQDTRNAMYLARLASMVEAHVELGNIRDEEFIAAYKKFLVYYEEGIHPWDQKK